MKKPYWLVIGCLFLFIGDRLAKNVLIKNPFSENFDFSQGVILNPIISFKLQFNSGIAFSIPLPNILSMFVSLLVFIIILHLLFGAIKKHRYTLATALMLVNTGAASNLLDRFKYGGVIDFISVGFWPTFNLADCYIVIGVMLIFWEWRRYSVLAEKTTAGDDSF